jgi:hypothetical protein
MDIFAVNFQTFSFAGLAFFSYILIGQWPLYVFKPKEKLDDFRYVQLGDVFITSLKVLIELFWLPFMAILFVLSLYNWTVTTSKRRIQKQWEGYLSSTS